MKPSAMPLGMMILIMIIMMILIMMMAMMILMMIRYGARRVLVSCLLLSGLACWLTGQVSNIASVNATLFVTGAALAPCWPACSKVTHEILT